MNAQRVISVSMLLFLSFALLINNRDIYRAFFFAGVMLPVVWVLIRHPKPNWFRSPLFLLTSALIGWLSINSLFVSSANFPAKFDQIRWGLEIWIFTVGMVWTVLSWRESPRLYGLWFGVLVLIAVVFASVTALVNGELAHRLVGPGFLAHPIQGASVLLVYWVLAFSLLSMHGRLRSVDIALLVCSGVAVLLFAFLSQSRGPILAAALVVPASMLAYAASTSAGKRHHLVPGIIVLGCFMVVAWLFVPDTFVDWAHDVLKARGLSYRPEIWATTIQYWSSYTFWGTGNATPFADTLPGQALVASEGVAFAHTHNLILQIFLVGGGVALLAYFGLVVGLISGVLNNGAWQTLGLGCCVLLATMMLVNLTDTARLLVSPAADWVLLWLPLCVVLALVLPASTTSGNAP